MILHSIACMDEVFYKQNQTEYEYRQVHNDYIQGVNQNGKFTINRLISTDPKQYLDPRYAPGSQMTD